VFQRRLDDEATQNRLSERQAERDKQIEAVGLQTQGAIGAAQAKSAGEQLDRDVKTSIAEGKNAADAANGIIDKGKPMRDAQGNPVLDMEGNPVMESYTPEEAIAIQDQVSRASRERELDPVASGRDIGQGAGLNPSTGQTVGAQADAMGTGAAFDADQSGDFSPTEAKKAASWSENTLNEFAKLSPEQQARAKNGPAYREAIAIKKRLDKLASDRVRGTVG